MRCTRLPSGSTTSRKSPRSMAATTTWASTGCRRGVAATYSLAASSTMNRLRKGKTDESSHVRRERLRATRAYSRERFREGGAQVVLRDREAWGHSTGGLVLPHARRVGARRRLERVEP